MKTTPIKNRDGSHLGTLVTIERKPRNHDAECDDAIHEELRILRNHKDRLDRELPQMRKENQRLTAFLQDANAFLRYACRKDLDDSVVLNTLGHDIAGLANDEPCFLPRVTGYAQLMAAADKEGTPR